MWLHNYQCSWPVTCRHLDDGPNRLKLESFSKQFAQCCSWWQDCCTSLADFTLALIALLSHLNMSDQICQTQIGVDFRRNPAHWGHNFASKAAPRRPDPACFESRGNLRLTDMAAWNAISCWGLREQTSICVIPRRTDLARNTDQPRRARTLCRETGHLWPGVDATKSRNRRSNLTTTDTQNGHLGPKDCFKARGKALVDHPAFRFKFRPRGASILKPPLTLEACCSVQLSYGLKR